MLYLDHDFFSNFNSGVESGDNGLVSDIIVNEISEIIVNKTADVIDLLNKVGIKVKDNASDEFIVDSIINNMSTNVKLNKGLAFLVAQNNDASKTPLYKIDKDGKKVQVENKSKNATIRQIDSVASGIIGLGDSFTYKPELKKEFKQNLMSVIKTKSKAVGERKRQHKNNSNTKYWLLAFVVVGAGIGIYLYIKSKNKLEEGGLLPDGSVAPTPSAPVSEVVTPDASAVV